MDYCEVCKKVVKKYDAWELWDLGGKYRSVYLCCACAIEREFWAELYLPDDFYSMPDLYEG